MSRGDAWFFLLLGLNAVLIGIFAKNQRFYVYRTRQPADPRSSRILFVVGGSIFACIGAFKLLVK